MIGTRIAHYEITAKLGEGGMGEVYRATDTKLNRSVALKILPEQFASDSQRMGRFQREAEVLASLDHPNIGAIHGIEDAGETKALVLQLIEGPTLADRIAGGPIPVDEALPIALQITEALEAAHEKGIIHRDLKPANIKLTPDGQVKVLDFGLAKAMAPAADSSVDLTHSPTLTMGSTTQGVLLGTAPYMSPEQARGQPVDNRADIWAFGVVVHEMLTGHPAFTGDTVSDVLARILEREPDFDALPIDLPTAVRRMLRRCLNKEPKRRTHDIADARLEVEDAIEGEQECTASGAQSTARSGDRSQMGWILSIVFLLSAIIAVVQTVSVEPERPPAPSRLAIKLPDHLRLTGAAHSFASPVTISPDGTVVVFSASDGEATALYRRNLASFDSEVIAGTDGATAPFFSPDGKWVGFFSGGWLQRIPLDGGTPVRICNVPNFRGTGVHWTDDQQILFIGSALASGILRVAAAGGTPEQLSVPDLDTGEYAHSWPQLLPGGQNVLFSRWSGGDRTAVLSLETMTWNEILPRAQGAQLLPTGHLLYSNEQFDLELVGFDQETQMVFGEAVPVSEPVDMIQRSGSFSAAVSTNGTFAYVPADPRRRSLVWVDRKGTTVEVSPETGPYEFPRISPDGTRISFQLGRAAWIQDVERGSRIKLTVDGFNNKPEWTPDSTRITFSSNKTGPWNLYSIAADGSGPIEPLMPNNGSNFAYSWSPDGQQLAFSRISPETGGDIWIRPPEGELEPFLTTVFEETDARFSPDGRFVAYASNESGQFEVYVQPYPAGSGRVTVSIDGGREPVWSRGSGELFYRQGDTLMVVSVATTPSFKAGRPEPLFEAHFEADLWTNYDVSADGERFLMVRPDPQAPREIRIVQHWFDEVRRLLPLD